MRNLIEAVVAPLAETKRIMQNRVFRMARFSAAIIAHPASFIVAVLMVVAWALAGPMLKFSDNWLLLINTGSSILTFLMMFLLQNMQNRDTRAMQMKLNELLLTAEGTRKELVSLEHLTEEELARYGEEFRNLHRQYSEELSKRTTPH